MGDVACCNFVRDVSIGFEPFDDEPVLDSLFEQYGRVIVQSMITSFGLDFLVADRHGGDVDTIHNVRQVGIDSEMTYKNSDNLRSYEERGPYDSSSYHSHSGYRERNAEISLQRKEGRLVDGYTGKKIKGNEKSDLDHIIYLPRRFMMTGDVCWRAYVERIWQIVRRILSRQILTQTGQRRPFPWKNSWKDTEMSILMSKKEL